jgi:hypothetical protein
MNLETSAPMVATSMRIPDGDPGTAATIAQMSRLIREGAKDPVVHELGASLVKNLRPYDWMGEAQAIYNWPRRNIRFTRDVRGIETLHSAREIIRLGIGDCDDFTILICALASTVGMKCRIVTVSADPRAPEVFSHVYPEVSVSGRWIALDAARRNPAFGRSPARYFRKRVWDVSSPDFSDVSGLGILPMPMRPRPAAVAPAAPYVPPPRRMRSSARYRLRGMRGLGIDAGDITGLISASASGASQIIQAARATPYNIYPGAQGQPLFAQSFPQSSAGGFFGLNTGTLLLLGIGVAVAVAAARR